jgi:hypothetical protein
MSQQFAARAALVASLIFVLAGCATRSISNSDDHANSSRWHYGCADAPYKGELSEFNVLGVRPNLDISDQDIQSALKASKLIRFKPGSRILLIQSGAQFPDQGMVAALSSTFSVAGFNGVPEHGDQGGDHGSDDYAKSLRLTAARAGATGLVVYWGVLETGTENLATKAISWVPFVGGAVPDQTQKMRIRLKVAVIDVVTGTWDMVYPEPLNDSATSGEYTRLSSDQAQVAKLKEAAYKATGALLKTRFVD